MPFQVIFEYQEASRNWEVFVKGAHTELEARQGFCAVLFTTHDATPAVQFNKKAALRGKVINNRFACFGHGTKCGWIKLFGIRLHWKHKTLEPLFSERNGYKRFHRIGNYRFNLSIKQAKKRKKK